MLSIAMGRKVCWTALGILLFLAWLGWATPQPVAADGFEVLADQQLIEFPHRMVFVLTAQAEDEIVEVRLDYRSAGAGVWAYSYPDFQRGRQVTATFTMTTDGASYLPPGALVEYFYTVRDRAGNVYHTPARQVEYADTRFEWQETTVGPLALRHHNRRQSSVDAVAADIEGDLQRVASLLGLDTEQPIKGVIYNRPDEAIAAFPNQSRTTTEQGVFQGFAFPEHGVFVGLGLESRIIVHESAHLLMHQAMNPGARPIPSWLNEGFASYVEPGSAPYSGQALSGRGLPLRAMANVSGDPHSIRAFYLKSESVVAYLIEEHGAAAFREFIQRLASNGETVDEALLAVYGFDVDGLETRWSGSDEGQARPPGGGAPSLPSPLVYLDTWLLGGVVLLAVIVVLGRFLWRRFHDDSDPSDRLQPWEDPDLQ